MKTLLQSVVIAFCLQPFVLFSQEKTTQDTVKPKQMDEVLVSAVRVTSKTPVTFSNLGKKQLSERNLGQDIPVLMNYLPSVVTTTDAGNGVGYTGIRVRGSDATRVNVTINGIPYNDSESQGTFWVNMPDFVSSVESLQLQRGVGTSTNGAGAFGASLNMLTDTYSEKGYGEIANSFGSFNTRKHTVKFSTGLMDNKFEIAGRLSKINSDGYIDRASSNLESYFLQGTYVGKSTLIKALVFGGSEKTYQSWNGLDGMELKDLGLDEHMLDNNPKFNISGLYFDENGNVKFYDNQTDNFRQDHYQLHWNEKWTDNWSTNVALHYTKGKGYYESYKRGGKFSEFGLTPFEENGVTIKKSDLINQKWLDNDFYGVTFSTNYKKDKLDLILGGGANKYEGAHFGKLLWVKEKAVYNYEQLFYDDFATKTDVNVFAKATYDITNQLSLFGDLQYRTVNYKANAVKTGLVDDTFKFFNPKGGLNYAINKQNNLYFSYAKASREPNRNDYEGNVPKPEKMDDYELGWRHASAVARLNVNAYYMKYKDQLVLTGALNDVGESKRINVDNSYRLGLEVDASIFVSDKWVLRQNVTVSQNKIVDFVASKDGEMHNFGKTNIAFSPDFIAGNAVTFLPLKNLQLTLLSKFVGNQYMGNIDSEKSVLKAYSVSDFNIVYEIKPKRIFKSIVISGLVNNIFNTKYQSNGFFYTYDDDWSSPDTVTTIEGTGYYPQARINFMAGLTLKF